MTASEVIPQAPGGLPLLGHVVPLLRDPLALLTSLPAYGDLVQIRLGPGRVVVVCSPELAAEVFRDDRTFDKGGFLIDRVGELLGDGLLTCPHDLHRRQRKLVQPAFRRERLAGYAQMMTAHTAAFTSRWHDGQVLDVPAEMAELTMAIAMETMFSQGLSSEAARRAADDLTTITEEMFRRLITPRLLDRLPTPGNRRYRRACDRLRQIVGDIIAERRADGADHGDFLSMLLDARDESTSERNATLTDTDIRDQVITLFGAGWETTANTLTWALHLLAGNPGIRDRVHAEVDAVLAGAPAGFEHLPKLELTSRVVTETLRLYPPGWILTRTVTADTHLGGYPVSPGTTVVVSPYLIHHRPEVFTDPERFDPDRWAQAAAPPRNASIQFGGGARKCVGDQFALTEAVLALATMTARWRLDPVPGQQVRPAAAVALHPSGLRMRVTSRTHTPSGDVHRPPLQADRPFPEGRKSVGCPAGKET
ncbi:cytochrome P450 [Nocardia sp. NBC_00416]|uniref:cytochrome P450 n=1 Tax=Nocardia sp. NBC_00416 TaxID=2975991 RepID=UPI002E1DF1AA